MASHPQSQLPVYDPVISNGLGPLDAVGPGIAKNGASHARALGTRASAWPAATAWSLSARCWVTRTLRQHNATRIWPTTFKGPQLTGFRDALPLPWKARQPKLWSCRVRRNRLLLASHSTVQSLDAILLGGHWRGEHEIGGACRDCITRLWVAGTIPDNGRRGA